MKKVLVFLLAATFGMAGSALAFHDGGVADCEGCHTMHNSQDGAVSGSSGTIANGPSKFLTLGTDPSSTCLTCHKGTPGSYHIMTDGTAGAVSLTPGGDFYWLTAGTYYEGPHGYISTPASHGHNVIAADYGIAQDDVLIVAPNDGSGTPYPAAELGCNSCHDPHGKVGTGTDNSSRENPYAITGSGSKNAELQGVEAGTYVLLGDVGYDGGQQASWATTFADGAPIAQSNRKLTTADHADYLSGMSEWCANCHTGFAQSTAAVTGGDLTGLSGGSAHTHPAGAGADMVSVATFYNKYKATGDFTATQADSYDILVPFERTSGAAADLDLASTSGPSAGDQVMCLSCHHAHASGFSDIGRWDFEATLLAESPIFDTTLGLGTTLGTNAYYGQVDTSGGVYGPEQRSLCNKCHLQD